MLTRLRAVVLNQHFLETNAWLQPWHAVLFSLSICFYQLVWSRRGGRACVRCRMWVLPPLAVVARPCLIKLLCTCAKSFCLFWLTVFYRQSTYGCKLYENMSVTLKTHTGSVPSQDNVEKYEAVHACDLSKVSCKLHPHICTCGNFDYCPFGHILQDLFFAACMFIAWQLSSAFVCPWLIGEPTKFIIHLLWGMHIACMIAHVVYAVSDGFLRRCALPSVSNMVFMEPGDIRCICILRMRQFAWSCQRGTKTVFSTAASNVWSFYAVVSYH